MKKLLTFTLPLWLVTLTIHAQSYTIDWDVIAGGGGVTTGGVYSVGSTIGQHTAGGSLSGGAYSLATGFWAIYAVSTAGNPMLSIFSTGTNAVVLSWPVSSTSWTLQQNTDLASGTWLSLSNTVSTASGQNQVILALPIGDRFFRLQSH